VNVTAIRLLPKEKKNREKKEKDCYNFLSLEIILRCSSGKFFETKRREILSEFDCSGTGDRSLNLSKTIARPKIGVVYQVERSFYQFCLPGRWKWHQDMSNLYP
jgi:hypothetical protein